VPEVAAARRRGRARSRSRSRRRARRLSEPRAAASSGPASRPARVARALARAIDAALAPLGFPPEGAPFHAHLTIGRVRSPRGARALAALSRRRHGAFGAWTARGRPLREPAPADRGGVRSVVRPCRCGNAA
jgi:hypothetical protein